VLLVGVDENGLGPRLGPLIATSVSMEVATYERSRLQRVAARVGIGDSKQTSAFGHMQVAEGLSLAIMETLHGKTPRNVDELLGLLELDGPELLRAACPDGSRAQCWSFDVTLPAFEGDVAEGRTQLARLRKHGVRLHSARSVVTCAGRMNDQLRRLGSRTSVDLAMFERLVLASARADTTGRGRPPGELNIVLGMVGGIRDYERYFSLLAPESVSDAQRTKQAVSYRVAGVGSLSFEIDADARHLPVAMASMLGKYVRELSMERQNRFYAHHQPDLPRPSGYYDPVTRRFIEQSRRLRTRLGIVDDCFER
jgi:ribonuclease HII